MTTAVTTNKRDIWTPLLITGIALAIWMWAASATTESRVIDLPVVFTVDGIETWRIEPPSQVVSVSAEGTQRAIQRADNIVRIEIAIPAQTGTEPINLMDRLAEHPVIKGTGIAVLSAVPNRLEVDVDRLVKMPANVRAVIPGVQKVDDLGVAPGRVDVWIRESKRSQYANLDVEAFVPQADRDRFAPGELATVRAGTRLPELFASIDPEVRIEPAAVDVSFRVRSQVREKTLDTPVRVQILSPPEDVAYDVTMTPMQLRDVTITAPISLIEKVDANKAVIVAVLHLGALDKESRIPSKAISHFLAIVEDGPDLILDGKVGEAQETHPVIRLTITPRDAG